MDVVLDDKIIEMIDKIDIKNDVELNEQINKIALTINAINKESMKKGDVELLKTENAELKSALEVNQADITALKALKESAEIYEYLAKVTYCLQFRFGVVNKSFFS